MKKKFLIILFYLVAVSNYAQPDNLSIQLDYATNLYNNNQFFDAITEYKRLIFFDLSKKSHFKAYFQIGKCYKAGAKLDDAIKYFALAEMNSNTDDERLKSKIEIVRCNILRKTTTRAHQLLDGLESSAFSKEIRDSIYYWRGWTYMFEDKWQSASDSFAKINPYHELKILCDRVEKDKVSVTFATVISYILPGAGQIYTGNYLSGLLSLGWNIVSAYLTIKSFNADRVFDGFAILTLLWQRFYRGNIQNAEQFALEKNIGIANNTLIYLQNQFKGIKP